MGGRITKGNKDLLGVIDRSIILVVVMVSSVDTSVKTCQIV